MSTMALEVAPFCTRVLAPFYLRVSNIRLSGAIEMSRYSSADIQTRRIRFLVGLLEVPIPQTTGYEGELILEMGASVSIGLCDGPKAFDPANGVFDDDANPSP